MFKDKVIDLIKIKIKENDLESASKHIPNYFLSSFVPKAMAMISIPILTRLLTPEEYGLLNIFGTYTIIIAVSFTFNLHSSIIRYYNDKKSQMGSFLYQVVLLQTFFLSCFFFISIIFNKNISILLNINNRMVLFLAPIALLNVFQYWITNYHKAVRESKVVRNYFLIKYYLGFVLTISFVYLLSEEKYFGKLYSEIFVLIFSIIFFARTLIPHFKYKLDIRQLKYMFSYSIQLIPAYLGGIFLAQIDRVMISSYIDNYSTGLYSYAYTLASIQSLLATVFYNAWIPDYFSHMNNQEYEKHDKGALSLLKILTLIACSLILFGDYIGKFLAPREFHDGLSLLPLIVLGIYFSTVTPIFQRNITFSKRTIWTSIIIIFSGLLNVFLNAIYLPKYGIIASASTTLVSYLIQFILTYLVVKYVIKLHYTKLFRVLYLFFPVIICGIVTYFSFDMIFLHSFIIRSITLIGCAIFLYGGIFYQLFNQSGN